MLAAVDAAGHPPGKPRIFASGQRTPDGGGRYQIGAPYQIAGKWYAPKANPNYRDEGLASWYGKNFHGRRTANGEVFDSAKLTAAHPTLPLPSYVRVTNLANNRSIILRVNDRGPFAHTRLIDVSEQAAELLDFKRAGMAPVRVEFVDMAPLQGGDQDLLLASYRAPHATPQIQLASAPAPVRRRSREAQVARVQLASLAAPSQVRRDRPDPQPVAFTAEPERAGGAEGLASEAMRTVSSAQPASDRIAMTFELLSGSGQ